MKDYSTKYPEFKGMSLEQCMDILMGKIHQLQKQVDRLAREATIYDPE